MRLLVSVANAVDASAALDGGADIIDAKDPVSGALGAVTPDVFRAIHAHVAGARPVTAALGDALDESSVEHLARTYAIAGASLVKIGFAGVTDGVRVEALIAAAMRGVAERAGVIACAYADANRAASLDPFAIVGAAANAGAAGVLLDTADKHGPGLRQLISPAELAAWTASARHARLLVALAGKITADDFDFVRNAGAEIVGVRGAVCDGGREGPVAADRVRSLRLRATSPRARRSALAPAPAPAAACE